MKIKGPCKPKTKTTPRVILNNPKPQANREHMGTYAIICKFMGLWPSEKSLQSGLNTIGNQKGYRHLSRVQVFLYGSVH